VYDYLLGGKDNYAADRVETARLPEVFPLLPLRARQNRLFLARAVAWLAGQDIRQFIDIGCGLPTANNTHQIAQAAHPYCRVAYVDRDPVVIAHAIALLSSPGVIALLGDLADPVAVAPQQPASLRPDVLPGLQPRLRLRKARPRPPSSSSPLPPAPGLWFGRPGGTPAL